MKLVGKKALVTGASSGIGRATAERLLLAGCDVMLLARRRDRLEAFADAAKGKFKTQQVLIAAIDLTHKAEVENAIDEHRVWLEGLGILVNNAGLARGADLAPQAQWEDWKAMIETNVTALFFLTHRLLPFLQKNSPSHIINLGSVAGRWTYPGGAVYTATKFAVRAFSEGLRLDLLGKNIRVTNIEPGMVETEFSEVRFGDKEKAKSVYKGMTPLTGEDVAECILWSLQQPTRVNIQELVVYPTDQASPTHVHRT